MSEDNSNKENKKPIDKTLQQVADKINHAENILVALSKDPSVDEMAAAIGLTIALDKAGKRATAIYSGATPNALQFLNPEKTLERNTNSLRDFIIALDKEKADRLQYKLEGDYIKVFITPYKSNLSSKDLEFTHGDYNVDLVIGIDVASEDSLDAALSEYGRIMHDASSINITNESAGRFCEIEWASAEASSVSEMIYDLIRTIDSKGEELVVKEVATALLTGIVASTDRFSNEKTTPETMQSASNLMIMGADQKLIASEITKTGSTEVPVAEEPIAEEADSDEPSAEDELEKMLGLTDEPEESVSEESVSEEKTEPMVDMMAEGMELKHDEPAEEKPAEEPVAEEVVAEEPVVEEPTPEEAPAAEEVAPMAEVAPAEEAPSEEAVAEEPVVEETPTVSSGKVIIEAPVTEEKPIDFSEMIETELAGTAGPISDVVAEPVPVESPAVIAPETMAAPAAEPAAEPATEVTDSPEVAMQAAQAAVDAALAAPAMPEYGMMPPEDSPVETETPSVEAAPAETPAMPQMAPGVEAVEVDDSAEKAADVNPVVIQPDTMGPVDPSAFKIPGM